MYGVEKDMRLTDSSSISDSLSSGMGITVASKSESWSLKSGIMVDWRTGATTLRTGGAICRGVGDSS